MDHIIDALATRFESRFQEMSSRIDSRFAELDTTIRRMLSSIDVRAITRPLSDFRDSVLRDMLQVRGSMERLQMEQARRASLEDQFMREMRARETAGGAGPSHIPPDVPDSDPPADS